MESQVGKDQKTIHTIIRDGLKTPLSPSRGPSEPEKIQRAFFQKGMKDQLTAGDHGTWRVVKVRTKTQIRSGGP